MLPNSAAGSVDGERVWLVTGCSSGFGFELASEILERGERLIATARNAGVLEGFLERYPERCRAFALDVTNQPQIDEVVTAAVGVWGRVDVLVNNAGAGLLGAVEEVDDAEMRASFETNFFGPLNVIRAVLPHLRAQKSGHIINMSAAAAISSYPGFGIYGGAKAALELASESLRTEVAGLGIKVTLAQPGPFRTGFVAALKRSGKRIADYEASSGKFALLLERMNGRQPGDPRKAAAAIVAMVQNGQAPFRLPLGKYVLKKLMDKAAALAGDAEEWASVAEGADSRPG